jgi:TolB-like protein/DNA-binding winged helix-turn-helix (wHTH) protein/tetratricopeptide (TPR) repeat protein
MNNAAVRIYEFGPFNLDAQRRLLLRNGERVRLSAKAFEILLVLLEENGRLVEKDELMRRVWPDAVVEENNLTVNMSALRKSLNEGPRDNRYLVTVPGRGYQFVADVRQHGVERSWEIESQALSNQTVSGVVAESQDRKGETQLISSPNNKAYTPRTSSAEEIVSERKTHRRIAPLILAALLGTTIVIAYLGYSRYLAGNDKVRTGSIAVLPFANIGDDPDLEYLSDGISESLINNLSELHGVKVIASNSSFRYRDKQIDFPKVATALGVDQIITGRVLRRGETLIINVELINGRDGTHLWGEQYDRKTTDVLRVQTEISRGIAERLRSHLNPTEVQQLIRRASVNPQAYELLLKGRFSWRKEGLENQKKALEYFQQAINIDPTYALAHAELAVSYIFLYSGGDLDPKEFRPKAEAAVYKALELDEGLADAHFALANLKQNDWQWAAAEQEYRRALQLNPNLAPLNHLYSFYLFDMGRYDESIDAARHARELDPLSLWNSANVALCLSVARRDDEAIEQALKTLEMDHGFAHGHWVLAACYAGKGMYREAIKECQESIDLGEDSQTNQIYLGAFYAKAGEHKKAREILKRLETSKEYVAPGELAVLYAALGEREQAFASLEKAYAVHDLQLQYLGAERLFDSLRAEPRFNDLKRRVGLP